MFPAHRSSRVRAKDREKILLQILSVEKTVKKVVLISWKELGSIRKDTKVLCVADDWFAGNKLNPAPEGIRAEVYWHSQSWE